MRPPDPIPLLRPHYRALNAHTDRSAPVSCIGTLALRFLRLGFSLGIRSLVPAVPRESLCPTHAPSTPVAARPIIRHPADLSQDDETVLVSTTLRFITARLRRVHFRSSFGHAPARISSELFIRRSPPRLFIAAARTGLRPAPESRSRRAILHHSRSFTLRG
ncbi:hypothetical protein Kim5_PA00362 (plasmid) [Rhizobium sp. Kim5]|nr:hypothetical protein Kim5_PA00362 [Rhizobium sp. Kim5]